MTGRVAEERVPVPMLCQRWREVLFVHWPFPAAAVASLLPAGLRPDLHDGRAWVTLTPFVIERSRPPLLSLLPGASPRFPETNLRTYVRGPAGVDGLWFFTLEVASTVTAAAGRLGAGLPYRRASMTVERSGGSIRYVSRRRGEPAACLSIRARPGRAIDRPGDLDDWLTGRWRAWAPLGGRLRTIPVRHQPWPLAEAAVLDMEESLLAAHGLPVPGRAPLARFSPGVDARLGPPRPA